MKDIIRNYSLKNNRKKILKNFYSKQMRKGKTFRANFIDKLFFYGLLFLAITFLLISNSDDFLLSLYMSSLFIFFFFKAFSKLNSKRQEKKIKDINEELKRGKILKEYDNFSNEDFVNNIKNILEEYLKVDIDDANPPMDLKFCLEGDLYGVKCLHSTNEYRVASREIGIFLRELKEKGIEKAIFITNSYFIDKERYKDRIRLYDFDDIVDILKKIDKYPTDLDIENYIVDRFLDRRSTIKKEIKRLNNKKIIQLYIIAVIFYLMSYFVRYQVYYKGVAIAAFIFATILGALSLSEYIYIEDK